MKVKIVFYVNGCNYVSKAIDVESMSTFAVDLRRRAPVPLDNGSYLILTEAIFNGSVITVWPDDEGVQ